MILAWLASGSCVHVFLVVHGVGSIPAATTAHRWGESSSNWEVAMGCTVCVSNEVRCARHMQDPFLRRADDVRELREQILRGEIDFGLLEMVS